MIFFLVTYQPSMSGKGREKQAGLEVECLLVLGGAHDSDGWLVGCWGGSPEVCVITIVRYVTVRHVTFLQYNLYVSRQQHLMLHLEPLHLRMPVRKFK
jgi:hypothetical protein